MDHSIMDQLLHHVHERQYAPLDRMMTSELETSERILIEPSYQRDHGFEIRIGTHFRCRDEDLEYAKNDACKMIQRQIYKYLYDDIDLLTEFVYRSGDREAIEVIKSLRGRIM